MVLFGMPYFIQLCGPSAFAPSSFGSGTFQAAFALLMIGASSFTLCAAHLDARSLKDIVRHAVPVVDGLTRYLHPQFGCR